MILSNPTDVKSAPSQRQQMSQYRPSIFAVGLVVMLMVVALPGIFMSQYLLISMAACSMMMVTLPLWFQKDVDWFSMWNFVVYIVFVGVLVRSFYITFDFPDASVVGETFLLGKSKEFLLGPATLMLLGLASMTLGYLARPTSSRKIPLSIFHSDNWNNTRLMVVAAIILIINVVALTVMINMTGGLSLTNLSSKRFMASYIETYNAQGYLRLVSGLSEIVIYLLTASLSSDKRRSVVKFLFLGAGLVLFLLSAIYQSSRGSIIFVLINVIAIWYYLHGRKINWKRLAGIGAFSLFVIQALTELRMGRVLSTSVLMTSMNPLNAINSIILNKNFVDVSKLAHIMHAIPNVIEFQWGRTLLLWAVAWIPRSIWHGKPITSIGQILGPSVFGTSTVIGGGGVPPGLFAELYWNFSVVGVIVGGFLAGFLLKFLYTALSAYFWNRNVIVLYVAVFMTMGMLLLGSDVTRTIIETLKMFIPLYLVLLFINERQSGTAVL